jgi:hypothetical protein
MAVKAAPGVDWHNQLVRATGSGAPDVNAATPSQARTAADKAARADALRNLLTQLKGIQITAGKTIGAAMADEEVRTRVETLARGYRISAKRYYSDMGMEIDVELPLAALTDVFGPASAAIASGRAGDKKNTGLIVDARGLKLTPYLAPRLIDESGQELYGIDRLSEQARRSSGVAAYALGMEQAKKSLRVGDRPLVLRGLEAKGSDIVLGAEERKKLGDGNNPYLLDGRVIIVID